MKKLMVGVLFSVFALDLAARAVIRQPFAEGRVIVYAKKGDLIDVYDYANKTDGKYHKVNYQKEMLNNARRLDEQSIKTFEVQEEGNHTLTMTAHKKYKTVGDRLTKKGHTKEVMKMKVQDF